jgi:aminopeptidase N
MASQGSFRLNFAHSGCARCSEHAFFSNTKPFADRHIERKYERSRHFQVTHLALDLWLDLKAKLVGGTATLDFTRRAPDGAALELDALGFDLREISLELQGESRVLDPESAYEYDGETIRIPVPHGADTGRVRIQYQVEPKAGLYFLAPDDKVPDRPLQVWSQCQDEDARHFIPCQDKPHVKMTTELRIVAPSGMTALSNGRLVNRETLGHGETFHYKFDAPQPAYLITLVVGNFDEWSDQVELSEGHTVTLRYLVPVGKVPDAKRAFSETANMMRLLSERTGIKYPFDSYSQVVVSDFIFGGMENTTATTMYEHILLDERAALDVESHDLVVHELAHQWFGDLVTCRDWSHAWLNEGFATFMELVEREARLGKDEMERALLADLDAYLGEASSDYQRPIVCRDYAEPIDLFDRHLYQKGGLVLHMLRRRLGDNLFWQGVRNYLKQNLHGIVDTPVFIRAMEEASGQSLERFFDEWVYRPGHPEVTCTLSFADGILEIGFDQKPSSSEAPVFELELEASVYVGGTWQSFKKTVSSKKDVLVVHTDGRPRGVVINPSLSFVAPLVVQGPEDFLTFTAENAPTAYGRTQAISSLKKRYGERSVLTLTKIARDEAASWIAREAALDALSGLRTERAQSAIIDATRSDNPKVRRAGARALGKLEPRVARPHLTRLLGDPSYLVTSTSARALGSLKEDDVEAELKPLLSQNSWAEVVRMGAIDGLAELGGPTILDTLMAQCEYGVPLRARRAAIGALGRVGEGRKAREHLERQLRDRDPHIRATVLRALMQLGDPKAKSAIADVLEQESDGRVLRPAKKALAELGTDRRAQVQKVQKDIVELESEIRTLKTNLAALHERTKPKPRKDKKKKKSKG